MPWHYGLEAGRMPAEPFRGVGAWADTWPVNEQDPDRPPRIDALFVLPVFIVVCGTVLAVAGNARGGLFFMVLGVVFFIAVVVTLRRDRRR